MHILVVEDERILCETIARSLKRLAYSVDCCYDGITAMQMLADDNFDLVVLDLNLPGADGMTVLRTLRKTDRDTKVLILSARSEVSDKVDGLDAGANDQCGVENRAKAIAKAMSMAQAGDVIVIAGKGDEDYQEICGVKHPMDERVLIKEVLEELKEK